MYITNNPEVAKIAENNGVDRIFVDMEWIGKVDRQGGMDTVQSHHTPEDVKKIREVISKSELMVRVNPIHEATDLYCSSKEEIDSVIKAGAEVIMLPFFKTVEEVKKFVKLVNGRAKTFLLLETPEAAEVLEDILDVPGIDEIHIGLNDMSLGYGMKFMFELLVDGKVEEWCNKISRKGIPYGFGGIASLGKGALPAEYIIAEHYRLGSQYTILSRSFCNVDEISELKDIETIFEKGVREIRNYEQQLLSKDRDFFIDNLASIRRIVKKLLEESR